METRRKNVNKDGICLLGPRPIDPKQRIITGLRSAVSNVSGNRFESDCRSRDREVDPGPVP